MEKNSGKIRLGTAVCMIIIFVLIIALAVVYYLGFIKYTERIANSDVAGNKEGMQVVNVINKDMNNVNETTNNNILSKDEVETNSFKIYQENYKNNYKKTITGENIIYIYSGGEVPGVYGIYLDSNNDAYFEFEEESQLYKKYGKTYKVESNVANIYLCPVGTGGYADVIFLKLDGTASSVIGYELEENPEVVCNTIEGVKNAVNVITYVYVLYNDYGELGANGPATVFVDINGNMISY